MNVDHSNYEFELRNFIRGILKNFITVDLDQYFTDENFETWKMVFRDVSYDPSCNYEHFEYLGDNILGSAFVCYLIELFDNKLTPNMMTSLKSHYMSKMFQAKLGYKLGLHKYILTLSSEVGDSMTEDVLEAFFGALWVISNRIKPIRGFINTSNMVRYLFSDIEIDLYYARGNAKTQVLQNLQMVGWFEPDTTNISRYLRFEETEMGFTCIFELPPDAYDYISKYVRNPIKYFESTERVKKAAESNVFHQVLRYLDQVHLTWDWFQSKKNLKDLMHPSIAANVPSMREKAAKYGFKDIRIVVPKTGMHVSAITIQLIGIYQSKTGEKSKVLASSTIASEFTDKAEALLLGRQDLVTKFLSDETIKAPTDLMC